MAEAKEDPETTLEDLGSKVGEVTHFFPDISVAVVSVEEEIEVGDELAFQGATTNFRQTVESMEVDHEEVEKAEEGQEVGMKVEDRVREGDEVFSVE